MKSLTVVNTEDKIKNIKTRNFFKTGLSVFLTEFCPALLPYKVVINNSSSKDKDLHIVSELRCKLSFLCIENVLVLVIFLKTIIDL